MPARASISQAATYYGVSTKTIRRWIADGRLPAYRIGPRLIRVDLGSVDDLVERIPTAVRRAA